MAKEETSKKADKEEEKPKKSKKAAAAETEEELEQKVQETLEKLMLDTALNKYDVILLARRWAYELKSKEGETRSLQELIAVAIEDILSARVSHKMVQSLPHFHSGKKPKTAPANILDALTKAASSAKKESNKTNGN